MKTAEARKLLNPPRTRRQSWVNVIVLVAIAAACNSDTLAQQVTKTLPRAVPAPWRPAFGPVNKSAAQSTNGTTNAVTPSNALDLTPSGSATTAPATGALTAPVWAPRSGGAATLNSRSSANTNSSAATPRTAQLPVGRTPFGPANQAAPPATRVTRLLDTLPNSAGQVWREYDISPYTSQVNSVAEPQQAVIDWVLRETGTEMWFKQPLGVLNASKNQLRVYHTPEIHRVIKPIVDRFIHTQGQRQDVDVHLITVGDVNWRAQSYSILQSIDVQSPGVEAWLVSKENAALLRNGLSKRVDYREHSSGRLTAHDGQAVQLTKTKPVQFVRNLRWAGSAPGSAPSAQPEMDTIDEGYRLELSVLSSLDNRTIEATVDCEVDQVERLNNVKVTVPGGANYPLQMNLQVPQLVSWRLKERFRWPADQVLVLGCGVVANPEPKTGNRMPLIGKRSDRAEALLFIDYRGPTTGASVPRTAGAGLVPVTR